MKEARVHAPGDAVHLGQVLELTTSLPGSEPLLVALRLRQAAGRSTVIGTTEIDLEDRWLSKVWHHRYGASASPVERRWLRLPDSMSPRGARSNEVASSLRC